MLLQSPPPDLTIHQAFDFASHLDRQALSCHAPGETVCHGPNKTMCHGLVAEILDSVAEMAEVRPVVFNRKQALARLGGLEDLLIEVMQVMQTESPKVHAQIVMAFARGEAIELKRAAHTLRGSVSIMGANDLAMRLRRVEDFAAASNFDAVVDELPEISRQFNALKCCLDEELMVHA